MTTKRPKNPAAFTPATKTSAKSEEDRLSIPLDPEEALRALLKVDPESEPPGNEPTSPRSLLEIAQRQLVDAEATFQRDPTDKNDQAVRRARTLVLSAREHEQKHGRPRPGA